MTIAQGQLINSVDFNTIHNKFYNIFGKGAGTSGYGQSYQASSIITGNIITKSILAALRSDMVKARQHQTGAVVGISTSNDGNNLYFINDGDIITSSIVTQYDNFANIIEQNKFSAHPGQFLQQTLVDTQRITPWVNKVTHTIMVSSSTMGDGSYDNFRYFFNAGGKLEFSVGRSGGSSSANNTTWTDLLKRIGTISFNHNSTSNSSTVGTANQIGFYSLASSDKILYSISDASQKKYFKLLARIENNKLIFSVIFDDGSSSSSIDGVLSSKLIAYKPSGNNVSVLELTATHAGIDYGVVPVPVYPPVPPVPVDPPVPPVIPSIVYSISPTVDSIDEGGTCTIELVCTDTTPRTLYWTTIGNVNNNDFTDNTLTGTINIGSNGRGTITRTIRADKITEPTREYFNIQFRTSSITGNVVATTKTIYINDTSVYELSVDKTTLSEGEIVTYTINSTSIANGTTLFVTIAGLSDSDVVGGIAPRTITIQNQTASGSITIASDSTIEGSEQFVLQLRNSPTGDILATSPKITVTDNSPGFSISFTGDTANLAPNSTINFVVRTTNIPNSTTLYVTMIGTVTTSDMVGGLTKQVIINNNTGSGSYTVANLTNYGTKNLSLQLRTESYTGNIVATTNQVSIIGKGEVTFTNTSSLSTFTVPSGITRIYTKVVGAGGGGGGYDAKKGGAGGDGSVVSGFLTVTPGSKLSICIGAGGERGYPGSGARGGAPGVNTMGAAGGGGGKSGASGNSGSGGAGGGASIITIDSKIVIAAGGGGGGGGGGLNSTGKPYDKNNGTNDRYNGGIGSSHGTGDGGGGGGGGGGVKFGGYGGSISSGDNGGYGGLPGASLAPSGYSFRTTGINALPAKSGEDGYVYIKW